MYGTDENYDVIINPETGDCEILRTRTIVEDDELENESMEIALSAAQTIDKDYEVGEEVVDKVEFLSFGRRAVLNLRQTLASRILELQKEALYEKYADILQMLEALTVLTMHRLQQYFGCSLNIEFQEIL